MAKRIKVEYKALAREKADGLMYPGSNTIYVDKRLKGKNKLNTILHEGLHILNSAFSEEEITHQADTLANLLWKQGYRCTDIIEETNNSKTI